MFQKYFFKKRFIKELTEGVWTEEINANFARQAYQDLMKIQENDVDLLNMMQNDLKDISGQEHANKDGKVAVKSLKNKIAAQETKIDRREEMLETLTKGIQEREDKVKMYKNKIDFVTKNG